MRRRNDKGTSRKDRHRYLLFPSALQRRFELSLRRPEIGIEGERLFVIGERAIMEAREAERVSAIEEGFGQRRLLAMTVLRASLRDAQSVTRVSRIWVGKIFRT